jgi:GTP-binding protein
MRSKFIISAEKVSSFPELGVPEIALVGRSNVGKSSLLNGLVGAQIARTSRTPGRTQLINFFEVESKHAKFCLADLPGYGFARAPGPVRARWKRVIEAYLVQRESLKAVLLLLDVRRTVSEDDATFFEELRGALTDRGGEVLVVATKCDKLSKADLKPALHQIAEALNLEKADVLATSTTKHIGLDTLREQIESIASDPRPMPSG